VVGRAGESTASSAASHKEPVAAVSWVFNLRQQVRPLWPSAFAQRLCPTPFPQRLFLNAFSTWVGGWSPRRIHACVIWGGGWRTSARDCIWKQRGEGGGLTHPISARHMSNPAMFRAVPCARGRADACGCGGAVARDPQHGGGRHGAAVAHPGHERAVQELQPRPRPVGAARAAPDGPHAPARGDGALPLQDRERHVRDWDGVGGGPPLLPARQRRGGRRRRRRRRWGGW
jgi:hypothetical protein